MSSFDFQIGDILIAGGETYQVLESAADHGVVIPYPSEITQGHKMVWEEGMRRIGNEPLPAPSPCSATGRCPTNGNPLTEEEVFAKRD